MIKTLFAFVLLQFVDLGTTVVVLNLGGLEQNILIQHLMVLGPIAGLVLAKLLAVGIGVGCYLTSRYAALRIANVAFTGIVAWNLSIIVRLL